MGVGIYATPGDIPQRQGRKIGKIENRDTIIVTIRGVRGHDRAGHGLPESVHPATRIL